MVYLFSGILLSHKKEWNDATCSNMDGLEMIILSEKPDRERQTSYDIVHIWNPKEKKMIQMNL